MTLVHLLHGFVGSGKSTFAKKLSDERNTLHFKPDEWMYILHGANPPADKFKTYKDNIDVLIWKMVERCIKSDIETILDFGFWNKSSRLDAIRKVKELGGEAKLYKIYCSDEEMKERVLERSRKNIEGELNIDENAIEQFRKFYEPINPTEETCIVIDTSTK